MATSSLRSRVRARSSTASVIAMLVSFGCVQEGGDLTAPSGGAPMMSRAAQQGLALDPSARFITRVPHRDAAIPMSGAVVSGEARASSTTVFGGTPYTVGPTVTPTTTVPEAEEHIAVDPRVGNSSNLVAAISDFSLRGGSNTTKFAFSLDNGSTWTESFVPLDDSNSPLTADGPFPFNSDPVVAIDKAGNVFLADLYFNFSATNSANGFYVSAGKLGTNLRFTAANTRAVATNLDPATTILEDKEWIAVDNSAGAPAAGGNVYVCWTRFTAVADFILFSHSTDHAATWSTAQQINLAAQNGAVQGCQVAVGPAGEVYVAYQVFFVGGIRQHFIAKSVDGGLNFSTAGPITPFFDDLRFRSTYRKNSFPALAVSPATSTVVDVYADQPSQLLGAEVEFIKSTDGGVTFTAPLAINDVSAGQQFFPAVTIDETGVIHASWFDTRLSPKQSSTYDIFATRSPDDGATFAPNARVTFAGSIDAGRSGFIGDYAGIAAAAGFAHPVWTDGGFNGGQLQTARLSAAPAVAFR
jgi:hypothetical protein